MITSPVFQNIRFRTVDKLSPQCTRSTQHIDLRPHATAFAAIDRDHISKYAHCIYFVCYGQAMDHIVLNFLYCVDVGATGLCAWAGDGSGALLPAAQHANTVVSVTHPHRYN